MRRFSSCFGRRVLPFPTVFLAAALGLAACGERSGAGAAAPDAGPAVPAAGDASPLGRIKTIVVIYAENRSFDNLYGTFPGADGIAEALKNPACYRQVDRDGKAVLATLPPVHGAEEMNTKLAKEWAFVGKLPNKPFLIEADQPGGVPGVPASEDSPDLVHRFYNHQMQVHGGKNDMFAAWSDAGGLAMGYYDGSKMRMWRLAREYTLADHFFMGAFGGSFLNHQYLIAAAAPTFPGAPKECVAVLNAEGTGLKASVAMLPSAMDGPPAWVDDGTITPDGHAVNTIQPSYQPSATAPAQGGDLALADPAGGGNPRQVPLPPQTGKTIGDTLSAKGVDWKWYSGAWNQALVNPAVIYNEGPGSPDFQPHHQPFNYFKRFDPTTPVGRAERAAHLKDYADLAADIQAGTLPPVVFYKPQGALNQHPGYTDIMSGDAHLAEVVAQLQAGPQWKDMLIIVTYDENGGFFDHVAPPDKNHGGDRWGPGSRVPALIISPYAKKGFVDHTAYDTTSILKLITRRFGLDPLPGVRPNMGDLTGTLEGGKK